MIYSKFLQSGKAYILQRFSRRRADTRDDLPLVGVDALRITGQGLEVM